MKRVIAATLLATACSISAAHAQGPSDELPSRPRSLSLSGPRVGFTVLTGEAARRAEEDHGVKRPLVTQFGWQFERRIFGSSTGPTGVFEWVLLVGGLDQGVVFPSVSWITGVRTPTGFEFGAGPNLTPIGAGFVLAAGMTFESAHMNFPFNLALTSSESGVRTSALIGFTTRR